MDIRFRKANMHSDATGQEISASVKGELVEFLFSQLPIALIAELIIVSFATIALWPIERTLIIVGWFSYFICFVLGGGLSLWFGYKYYKNSLTINNWIKLFTFGIILTGIFWGFMGGYLMPRVGLVYQSFVVFVLLGITSGANSLFSANRIAYASFLFFAFIPLIIRLYLYGGLFILLGTSAVIYMLAMLVISASNYKLLKTSIMLRFENTGLDLINQDLERNIIYQTTHDALTQLPNRHLLYERMEHDLALAHRFKSLLAVMYLDLDHFKDVNDSLGSNTGDIVLQVIAKRLIACVRKSDTVARIGGDEFILLIMCKSQQAITSIAKKVLQEVALPITIRNDKVHLTASIGLCIYPHNGVNSNSLLRNADFALYLAKQARGNNFQIYSDSASATAKRQQQIQRQLVKAKGRNEFSLVYQPIFDIVTNKIVSAEALIRWMNPILGQVAPDEFIAIAEDIGNITILSDWIISEACKQNKQWQLTGAPKIPVAVNISALQLRSGDITHSLSKVLSESKLEPRYLTIEITETSLMDNSELILQKFQAIRNLNIEIAIDDFGTGYSSFYYLTEFPISRLKIDKSLIQNCDLNAKNRSVINAIVTLSHQLNLKVIAEGVETANQLAVLNKVVVIKCKDIFSANLYLLVTFLLC